MMRRKKILRENFKSGEMLNFKHAEMAKFKIELSFCLLSFPSNRYLIMPKLHLKGKVSRSQVLFAHL